MPALIDTDICYFTPEGDALVILDQTQLPTAECYKTLHTAEEVAQAIYRLEVRGAPLIGVAAAMGLCVSLRNGKPRSLTDFWQQLQQCQEQIGSSRPTAVNLRWALNRMVHTVQAQQPTTVEQALQILYHEAEIIKRENADTCRAIGGYGSTLIREGMGVLTHCNAGHLATGCYGTALSPIYMAHHEGKHFKVYADETRPLLQGARLTAYELQHSGVDVTLLCDNMAATLMAQGKVDLVLVGCDRVAANGDVANKIGTLGVAILAHHYGIPVYCCGPLSTFDPHTPTGADIVIEQRHAEEVTTQWYSQPMAPEGCKVYNPAFDITPHHLIAGYVTEQGIGEEVATLLSKK